MEELMIWEQHTITLSKDSKMGFGFAISGGRDKPNPDSGGTAVMVSDVVRNGPAMGRLFVRDQIVMVNGVSMDNVYSTFTIQNLKSCGKTANITVKRPRKVQLPASTRPSRAASHSNLLDQDPPRRIRRYSDGSDQARNPDHYSARSTTSDRNGTAHALPLMSGYKRLPHQDFLDKPIKTTLLKKKLTDEYGLKLGSQIFIKHMTETGLAAKEGTLQEGDLILKINGMTTENLSLLETKHLVEKSRGKLTMMVLRDDRKFLVSIPEVDDSAPNSEEDRRSHSSSELEGEGARAKGKDNRDSSSPVRSTLSRPAAKAYPSRRGQSRDERLNSFINIGPSHSLDHDDNNMFSLSSPVSLYAVVSESDSDRSASPPPRRGESSRVTEDHSRYRVLPDLPHPGTLSASPISIRQDPPRRVSSPVKAPPPGYKVLTVISISAKTEEPIYSLPPDSIPTPNLGYSSDLNTVSFVKEGSVGLRLVGGNDVGIFVGGVQPNSPAHEQGMKEGDQIMQVNGVDFGHFNREEAAMFLINIKRGEPVDIRTQNKMDIYKKILKSNLGDSFYIRTHFDNEAEGHNSLAFTRGEVFRVVDTMHRGKLGKWLAIRMGNDLHELDKGTIPNQAGAETLASMEQAQRASGGGGDRQVSGPRAEFWKLRGLRGAKKNVRRTRDDLLQLTIQGKFPAYERVLLREANFKRPIVILGPLNDVAMEKLAREMPDEYEVAEMVPRSSGADSASTVIKLDTVRRIAEKVMKQTGMIMAYMHKDGGSHVKWFYSFIHNYVPSFPYFPARIALQPSSNVWYETLKDKIRHQQAKPVWVSEVTLEGGGEEELDALDRTHSDYLSAASDLEDTDGEAFTDGEVYTDNEDLEEPFDSSNQPRISRPTALARSSEPAAEYHSPDPSPEPLGEVPPLMHVPEPRSTRRPSDSSPHDVVTDDTPSYHSFSDSDFSAIDPAVPTTHSDEHPDFIAPNPRIFVPEPPSTHMAEPQERKASPSFIVLAHHQAVQTRRTQIRGSDSSDDNDETEDFEWGPATEL
uniref:Tight junction protein 3 n=1 Tax=Oncorhynchus kisutch TaxID=8019 RepID=A0A8C7F4Q2_ONCKI